MVHKMIGTKAEVWHGIAAHTKGGLTKHQLTINKKGEVVSLAKHTQGVKNVAHTLGSAMHRRKTTRGHAMLGGYLL